MNETSGAGGQEEGISRRGFLKTGLSGGLLMAALPAGMSSEENTSRTPPAAPVQRHGDNRPGRWHTRG